ncbi:phasin family protein [Microvirga alba]|uniref:Phasin family protein n=1 Tax=Microvirga alba TaxID=2791025 RepID=A0A931FQD7_9HYPH|nr:phasin family protein [Microvirga alba]MBF9234517.1 phasin family protein [Microvirga alba]
MPGKLKEHVGGGSDGQLSAAIRDSANQIWLAGLGAFAKAQKEGTKMFDALVKEGETIQNRAKKAANEQMADVRSKATGTWDKLEKVFESRVDRALHSLNVPTKKDIDSLSKRVSELTAVTKKLSESVGGSTARPARTAAKKSVAATRSHRRAA